MTSPTREAVSTEQRRSLWIKVPDEKAGLELVERLGPLGAWLDSHSHRSCGVAVELQARVMDDTIIRAIDIVSAWVTSSGIEKARLELDGRVHVVRS